MTRPFPRRSTTPTVPNGLVRVITMFGMSDPLAPDSDTQPSSPDTLEEIIERGVVTTIRSDGVDLAVQSWPGDGDVVLFAHATGFHKEIWAPTIRELRARGVTARLVAVDLRGHGDSLEPPFGPSVWEYARDVTAVAEEFASPEGRLIGVGHSLGGMAVAAAEVVVPGSFAALVLIDPVLISPGQEERMSLGDSNPWADGARRRRQGFPSRQDAYRTYAAKQVFSRWPDEVLRLYVNHGFTPRNGMWTLKCSPEWEAATFSQPDISNVWGRLDAVNAPVTLITAEHSATHPPQVADAVAARLSAHHVRLPGITHFIPMEAPESVAAEIVNHLDEPRPGP